MHQRRAGPEPFARAEMFGDKRRGDLNRHDALAHRGQKPDEKATGPHGFHEHGQRHVQAHRKPQHPQAACGDIDAHGLLDLCVGYATAIYIE